MENHTYHTLIFGEGYLKNFTNEEGNPSDLHIDQAKPFTADDLRRAETDAFHRINTGLIKVFDVSGWEANPPEIIKHLANLIGSGYAWLMKFGADTGELDANELLRQGADLLSDLRSGRAEVIGPNGQLQSRRILQDTTDIAI